jgi:uncharacterized protein YdaU (DUF1376 family)
MPIWWGDHHAETRHLNLEQRGAYLLLLGHYWQHGPLADDESSCASAVAPASIKERTSVFVPKSDTSARWR